MYDASWRWAGMTGICAAFATYQGGHWKCPQGMFDRPASSPLPIMVERWFVVIVSVDMGLRRSGHGAPGVEHLK